MNNPFIVSSSPLALYQKAVALKKEKKKKWHKTLCRETFDGWTTDADNSQQ